MISHHWGSGKDVAQGGYFTDDDERIVCRWAFDPKAYVITVRHGHVSRPTVLSGFGIDLLDEVNLRERLVALAGDICRQLQREASGE